MTTVAILPEGYPAELTGYADPWIASPGGTVEIKVSCTESSYKYRVVRVTQGVDVENSPAKQIHPIDGVPEGETKGRFQLAKPGSYAIIKDWLPAPASGVMISFYMQPWVPVWNHAQVPISNLDVNNKSGFAVVVGEAGKLEFWIGTGSKIEVIPTGYSPEKKMWTRVSLTIDGTKLSSSIQPIPLFVTPSESKPIVVSHMLRDPISLAVTSKLLFGACFANGSATTPSAVPTNFFNGRIDSPTIMLVEQGAEHPLLRFDFSVNMSSDYIHDISGRGLRGTLINAPTRAVKGYDWDGTEVDWTRAKYGYGAIHFHEDDLDDAGWETDLTIKIPSTCRSGVYAVEIETIDGRRANDSITFFVRPSESDWTQRGGKVAFVLSTFTYLAYANEHLWETSRRSAIDIGPGFDPNDVAQSDDLDKLRRRFDLGLSTYDVHNDDSSVIYSSWKRPILNARPGYVMWAFKRPRELSADLMMIGFLEREGIPYEVLTDHDLHRFGVDCISRFNTVITGSHPEYPTLESYMAYKAFAAQGGNLMYLGGNGFYWVSAVSGDPSRMHRLEIRRGDQGVRTHTAPGGERINATNGQLGTLWRSRGMPCNVLFGVGFSGEGVAPGVPYRRTAEGRRCEESEGEVYSKSNIDNTAPPSSWIFRGISPDELIGEFGLGGGASGDEIDRFGIDNDSHPSVKVLASSTGHSDEFGIAPEDTSFPIKNVLGTQNDNIRSDMTYYVTSGGGGVFSVGSINFFCSLGWMNYRNNVAQLVRNVITGFLEGRR
ncbi:putative large subunit of -dimethylformamidase protein [Phaeoacremonium minimum UCRPA7]|uniref:Putative large subunit of-dimethylformamidase protein n=1 Tax=Phaeoacremonium minimum (strain UCR-PA7) TaxID=1286976 RepID=R8BMG3_PHAM7|nr:putative large subunit of -dimethylformamidase protein [Phaeoacremonium minimum UCRPA7]EOO00573.1 putative large subunit of -dimethylformamidase protein [Phaeoacremonium minimum UCRPA7]